MKILRFNEQVEEVESPCIGVCKLDGRGVCEGCKRTAQEIKHWWDFSNMEKSRVIDRLNRLKNKEDDDWYDDDSDW